MDYPVVGYDLATFFSGLYSFFQWIFDSIFGDWNYHVLFSWLPQDIILAVDFLIIFVFALAIIKWIKSVLPL